MSAASHFFGGSNSEVPLRVLVVAGGGGSGGWSVSFPGGVNGWNVGSSGGQGLSGSGGGGAVQELRSYPGKRGRTYDITVGAGGTAGIATDGTDSANAVAYRGGKGEDSVFTDPLGETFTAEGGGGGGAGYTQNAAAPYAGIPYAFDPNQGGNADLVYGEPGGCGGAGATVEVTATNGSTTSTVYEGGAGNAFSRLSRRVLLGPQNVYSYSAESSLIETRYGVYGGFPATLKNIGTNNAASNNVSGGAGSVDIAAAQPEYRLAPNAPHTYSDDLWIGNGYNSNIEGTMKTYGSGRYSSSVTFQNPNVPDGSDGSDQGRNHRSPNWSNYVPVPNTGHGAYGVHGYPNNHEVGATGYRWEGPGAVGSSGVVIVQYPSSFGNATTTGTVTDLSSNTPGYKTYKFTTDGTIQLPS